MRPLRPLTGGTPEQEHEGSLVVVSDVVCGVNNNGSGDGARLCVSCVVVVGSGVAVWCTVCVVIVGVCCVAGNAVECCMLGTQISS